MRRSDLRRSDSWRSDSRHLQQEGSTVRGGTVIGQGMLAGVHRRSARGIRGEAEPTLSSITLTTTAARTARHHLDLMPTPFGGLPMRSLTCHDGCACEFVGASATINWCVMRTSLWSMRARASMGLRLRCAHRRRPRAAHPVPSNGAAPSPTVATVDVQLSVHSR